MGRLSGQITIVTGASSGIGRATALALAAEGAIVAAVARRKPLLAQLVEEIASRGGQAMACPADVTDEAAIDAVVKAVLERFGRVDLLVNDVGWNSPRTSFDTVQGADWQAVVDACLTSAFNGTRAVLPAMRAQGKGTIVNVASYAGMVPSAYGAAYNAAKAGVLSLTEAINLENRQFGIRAGVILPGETDTPQIDERTYPPPAEARQSMLRPEDVAAAIVFMARVAHRATVEWLVLRPTVLRDRSRDVEHAIAAGTAKV